MDFSVITNTRFTDGTDILLRTFSARKLRNGKIEVQNEMTGKVQFILNPSEITIAGNSLKNVEELQAVVYNFSCICEPDLSDDDFKIFDKTFDNTFE